MVDQHLFSLTRKSQLNLLPKQWGLGTWRGDNQGLESEQEMSKNLKRAASLKVRTYRHTPIIWKIDQNGWRLTLLFNSLCFFFCFFLSKVRHWVHGLLCIWFLATLSLANLIFFQCWRTLTSSLVFIDSEHCAATGTAWRHIGQDLRFLRRFCQCRGCPPHLGQGHRFHRHHSPSSVKSVNHPCVAGPEQFSADVHIHYDHCSLKINWQLKVVMCNVVIPHNTMTNCSRYPCCVLLALSWNTITNENPSTDELSRAIN